MIPEPTQAAFRAQLIIAEQRELYDYWLSLAGNRHMPDRGEIDPCHFHRLLPFISILERAEDRRMRVRLAGTRLRDIYEREITGLFLDELDWGDKREYWAAVYDHVKTTCRPAQGAVRGPRTNKDHLVQFWLRLPLSLENVPGAMILCHDTFVSAVNVPRSFELHTPEMVATERRALSA